MKKKYQYQAGNRTIEREYDYIPVRYIVAVLITVLEIAAIIGIMIAICLYPLISCGIGILVGVAMHLILPEFIGTTSVMVAVI